MNKKWVSGYQFVAVQVFTLLLLVVVLNGILSLFYAYKDQELKRSNPIVLKYGRKALRSVYPSYSDQEQDILLTETWTRKQEYESFTGFKEAPFKGKYLNVHPAGFRMGWEQGPWPLDSQYTNVFVFGGSTTFGYGVADSETLPSHLQRSLKKIHSKVRCYNFGRGFYYSVQERALFEKLLLEGVRPDLVVFVDGLNEYAQPEPEFVEQTQALFAQKPGTLFRFWFQGLSLSRLARSLRYRLLGISPEPPEPKYSCAADSIQIVHQRYWQNRKLIEAVANKAKIPSLFVWQPISCYEYQPKEPFFLTLKEAKECYPGCGYAKMYQEWDKYAEKDNSLWLAGIQQMRPANRYVDKVHYTSGFHAEIADSIVVFLSKRGILNYQ
ncbi:SGNH/GDSL hydrolase family protein [Rufibacter latericius]|uniref:SGNH/GDSL hydrolase family protein n=1 Tax=Rufibacter latericius TaxID=2487040 RepID=A0A3M9MAC9_9BACT|nr:SGNH/GDSL hydrolase family protein [Rufibacter latericius]RNI22519.1 SGNH/GDSL hydrolase family protein [Rufibacter latericius]